MNETLQPGLHLDADTLSAFAEGALPAHERDATLAHLAVCPLCRELVQLAQPPVEELQPGGVVPARFAGWRWLWAGMAACAGVGLATIVLERPHPAAAPAATTMTAKVEAPAMPEVPSAQPAPAPARAAVQSAPPPPPKVAGVLKPMAPAPAVEAVPAEGSAGMATGATGGAAAPGRVAQDQLRNRSTQDSVALKAAPPIMMNAAPAPTALPPPMAAAAQAAVEMNTSAAQVETQYAMLGEVRQDLPSHLPVSTRYAEGERVVAADTAGTVFLSKDAGRHWSRVKAGWGGRVVLVGAAAETLALPAPRSAMLAQKLSDKAGTGSATVQGTVSDQTGAAIPGASVALREMEVLADRAGNYVLRGVAAGQQELRVEAPGFAPAVVMLTLVEGQHDQQNVKLSVGSATQTITATNASPIAVAKASKAVPVFALRTENGERWVSVDGKKWTHE